MSIVYETSIIVDQKMILKPCEKISWILVRDIFEFLKQHCVQRQMITTKNRIKIKSENK